MKDIIDKTKKIVRLAGHTEQAQYTCSKRLSRANFCLSWIAIGMTITVGASFFTPYEFSDPRITAFVSLGAGVLILLVRAARLSLRSAEHLITGNLYARILQDGDILLLKMQGGDLSRAQSLIELETLNASLCDLILKTIPAPHRVFRKSAKKFDRSHPELKCFTEVREPNEFLRAPAPQTSIKRK